MLRLLVVEAGAGSRATVWGWAEARGFGTTHPPAADLTEACGKAMALAEEMAQDLTGRWVVPDRMIVGLPAAQTVGRAWPISQKRSRPDRPVEERELDALLARGLRLAINRLQSLTGGHDPWLLVDAAPVVLTVDGRGVTDPVGFSCREVGATIFAALAPAGIIGKWRTVAEMLEFTELTLTAAPLALAATPPASRGLIVDVGGVDTGLVYFRAGQPVAVVSLPMGGADITRSLLRRWHITIDAAERLKQTYLGSSLDAEARAEIQEALLPAVTAWLEEVEAALAHLNEDGALPQQVYLTGGGSVLPEIGESMRALAWSRHLHFERYPQVRTLRPTDVPGVVNRTELGRTPGSVAALALAAWAARRQQPPDRPARLLTQLSQI
ncbi:MAG: hypothetical protein JXA93_06555 [Anaerolineae bacterium]|nr:hypothetical protein [Anaerolineae bacterium]